MTHDLSRADLYDLGRVAAQLTVKGPQPGARRLIVDREASEALIADYVGAADPLGRLERGDIVGLWGTGSPRLGHIDKLTTSRVRVLYRTASGALYDKTVHRSEVFAHQVTPPRGGATG